MILGIEHKRCCTCKIYQPLDYFSKNKSTSDGFQDQCKSCFAKYRKEYYKQNFLRSALSQASDRHKEYEFQEERFDLTLEILESQFNGLCGYSLLELVPGMEDGAFNSPSLDRMNNNIGYEASNIIFVAQGVNTSKNKFTYKEWLEGLIALREAFINKAWLDLKPGKLEEAWYLQSDGKRKNYKGRLISNRRGCNNFRKKIPYSLTKEGMTLTDYCPVLGYKLKGPNEGPRAFNSITIDRIDPFKDYTNDNCWFISDKANTIKAQFTPEQITGKFFEVLIERVKLFAALEERGFFNSPAHPRDSILEPLQTSKVA